MVTLETRAVQFQNSAVSKKRILERCRLHRTQLCSVAGMVEERVPLEALADFWRRHERYARLPLEYPEASVLRDALPWGLVEAYRGTFNRSELPATAFL